MANNVSGRMVHRKLAMSQKWTDLRDPWTRLLYVMLVIFVDNLGRMHADPWIVKSTVFPRDRDVTPDQVEDWLQRLHEAELIRLYDADGDSYLYLVGHEDNQTLRSEHSKSSDFPPPPALTEEVEVDGAGTEQHLHTPDADTSPEVEVEEEEEKKKKGDSGSRVNLREARADVVAAWNSVADEFEFPNIRGVNSGTQRHRHLKARLDEDGFHVFMVSELRERIAESPFLKGEVAGRDGRDPFQLRFDWLVANGDNWVKVAEGSYYSGKPKPKQKQSLEERLGEKEV